jgi:translation initiation factor eIF-2B subunit epsilon
VDESELPLLPKRNAHYIQHENVCYDFGTIGWFLSTHTVGNPWINQEKKINITHYKYFLFINSSVRGPFFLPYLLKFLSDYKEEFEKSFY